MMSTLGDLDAVYLGEIDSDKDKEEMSTSKVI